MKNTLVILVFTFCSFPGVFAQNVYQSLEGHVVISGEYRGETVLAESHRLNLFLNYETKEFKGKLDLSTLDTGLDSLNAILAATKPAQVLFTGVIPNDDFITWEHLELDLDIPLTVQFLGNNLNPSLNIKLNHYKESSYYACLLSGEMYLDISGFENRLKGLGDTIEVKLSQVLMRRDRQ